MRTRLPPFCCNFMRRSVKRNGKGARTISERAAKKQGGKATLPRLALERRHVKGYFFLLCHDMVTMQSPCSSCGVQGLSNEGCPSLYPAMPVLMNALARDKFFNTITHMFFGISPWKLKTDTQPKEEMSPSFAFNELMHMVRVRTIAPLSGGINFGVGEASTSTSPSLLTRGAEKVHPISSR